MCGTEDDSELYHALCFIRYVRVLPDLEIPQAVKDWIHAVEFQDT